MPRRTSRALLTLLIAGITCAVFARLIPCDFTSLDDQETIYHNPLLNPPTWATLGHYWTAMGKDAPMALYAPMTYTIWTALAVVARRAAPDAYGIWLNPHVYHAANVLLHALAAAALFQLLRLLVKNDWAAVAGALLFALHPLQVEAVGWASGTKDVLCGLFSILALWQYVVAVGQPAPRHPRRHFWLATLCFVLAMLSKPTGIVVPLIAGVIDRWIIGRSSRLVFRSLWPWAILMIPCALWTMAAQPALFVPPLPAWTRPLIAADALAFYLWKLIWPVHLSVDYGRWPLVVWNHGWIFYTWIVPAILAALLICRRNAWRIPAVAGLIFVIGLLPVLGLKPFQYQYHSTVADHYLYLSMIGPALAAAWILSHWHGRWVMSLSICALVLLAVRCAMQEAVWQNHRSLSAHAVAVSPGSFGAWGMLGGSHLTRAFWLQAHGKPAADEYAQSAKCYEQSLALNPQSIITHRNLAAAYRELGRTDDALNQMWIIVRLQSQLPPNLRDDPVSLAIGLDFYGDPNAALTLLDRVLNDDPHNLKALQARAKLIAKLHHPAGASN